MTTTAQILRSRKAIVFNTMAKSASEYIIKMLADGLGRDYQRVSQHGKGGYPRDDIDVMKLQQLAVRSGITKHHFHASEHNVSQMRTHGCNVIVHVRDPRQATLSWVHHVDGSTGHEPGWTLEQKIDHQIAHYFENSLWWINGWLNTTSLPLLFTSYEQFHRDRSGFIDAILEFCSIPKIQFVHNAPSGKLNFRKGEIDEWRTVFTAKQQNLVTSRIPNTWFDMFGWER